MHDGNRKTLQWLACWYVSLVKYIGIQPLIYLTAMSVIINFRISKLIPSNLAYKRQKGSWYEMSIRSQIFLNGKAFSYSWHDLSDLIYSRNGYVWHNAWGKHEDLKHLVTVGVSGHLSYMPQNRQTFVARCLIVMPDAVPGFIFKHIFRASRPEMGGVVVLVSGGGGSGGWVGV